MQDNQDVVIETDEFGVVIGMQAFTSETESGEPLLVMRLDTDGKPVLWSFDQSHFQVFLRAMLRQTEIFEGDNAESEVNPSEAEVEA